MRRHPIMFLLAALLLAPSAQTAQDSESAPRYVCAPCGCSEDGRFFDEPGECAGCGMDLVQEEEIPSVGIVIFKGVELLDFSGPGEVFAAAGCRVFTIAESTEPIISQGFLNIVPNHSLEDCPPLDLLVIPGGSVGSLLRSPDMMEWMGARSRELGAADKDAGSPLAQTRLLSVCNGALVLAKLGLLDGLEATTHHGSLDSLRTMAPKATVHDDRRFIDNGRIMTAAGVSAGIDAALHFVARRDGMEAASSVARYMEYAWDPALTKATIAAKESIATKESTAASRNETRRTVDAETAGPLPLALGGLDPVRLSRGTEELGDEARGASDGRYQYWFSSDQSLAEFLADTRRYGVQARGSCAGMGARLSERSGKPDLFIVHDGYVYLFAGERCREDFVGAPEAFIAEMREAAQDLWGESVGPSSRCP